jgi:O-methyltransferase
MIDRFFEGLVGAIRGNTLITEDRLFFLYQCARHASFLSGAGAECGVYKGGSAWLLAEAFRRFSPQKKLFLFDTFEGMPAADPIRDLHRMGDFNDTSFGAVRDCFNGHENVFINKGLFSETLRSVDNHVFSLVHADCDIYTSVKECCEFFYPRMVSGGIIVFDDYGFDSCPGAKLGIDEFFDDKPEKPILLPTGQGFIVKIFLKGK